MATTPACKCGCGRYGLHKWVRRVSHQRCLSRHPDRQGRALLWDWAGCSQALKGCAHPQNEPTKFPPHHLWWDARSSQGTLCLVGFYSPCRPVAPVNRHDLHPEWVPVLLQQFSLCGRDELTLRVFECTLRKELPSAFSSDALSSGLASVT